MSELPEISDELNAEFHDLWKIKNEAERWQRLAEWSERANAPQPVKAQPEAGPAENESSRFETNGDIFSDRAMEDHRIWDGIIPKPEDRQ